MSRASLFRTEVVKTDDSGPLQTARAMGYADEEVDGAHVIRQHGLASHAPVGSHGFGLMGSGERGLVALLGLEHQDKRPRDLKEGQTVLYDDKGNATRMLGADGIWHDAGDRAQKVTGKTVQAAGKEKTLVGHKDGKVYLGGDGSDGTYARVMTESGPSSNVYARIG